MSNLFTKHKRTHSCVSQLNIQNKGIKVHSLNIFFQKPLFFLCWLGIAFSSSAQLQLNATWTGNGDAINWSDPNNWDTTTVPCNFESTVEFDVTIPDNSSVTFDVIDPCEIKTFTLRNDATLKLLEDTSLTVLADTSITGIIDADGGDFVAAGTPVEFAGNRARVYVNNGSQIHIAATSYSSTGLWNSVSGAHTWIWNLFTVVGAGSTLDLSALMTINAGFDDSDRFDDNIQRIEVLDGGTLNLSGLLSISAPGEVGDRLELIINNPDSQMDLSSLQTFNSAGAGQTKIEVLNNASLTIPSLETANMVLFDVSGAARLSVNGSSPVSYSSTGLWTSSGGDSWNLFNVIGPDSTLDLSAITSINAGFDDSDRDSNIHQIVVSDSGTLNLSGLLSITAPKEVNDQLELIISDPDSEIDLSSLQTFTGIGAGQTKIKVFDNASLSMPSLETANMVLFEVFGAGILMVNGPSSVSYSSTGLWNSITGAHTWAWDLINVVGSGSTLDLSAITSINAGFDDSDRFDRNIQQIVVSNGAALNLSGLLSISGPKEVNDRLELTLSDLDSQIDLSSLRSFNSAGAGQTKIEVLNNALLSIPSLESADMVLFDVAGAATLSVNGSSPVSYSSTGLWTSSGGGMWKLFNVVGAGSTLDLSAVTSINAGFDDSDRDSNIQQINAEEGSVVNLSGLITVIPPKREDDSLNFDISGGASLILGEFSGANDFPINLTNENTSIITPRDFVINASVIVSNPDGVNITIEDDFSYLHQNEEDLPLGMSTVSLNGIGCQKLEVGGLDVGTATPILANDNFGFGQMVIGEENQATIVKLIDDIDNGNRLAGTEALYLYGLNDGSDGLRIHKDSIVVVGDVNVYTSINGDVVHLNSLFDSSNSTIPFDEGLLSNNRSPTLIVDIDQESINELAELSFKVRATDPDAPEQSVQFSLDEASVSLGASIDPITGEFSFRPGADQGPATYEITITVSDDGIPSLSDSHTVTIVVVEPTSDDLLPDVPGFDVEFFATVSDPISLSFDTQSGDLYVGRDNTGSGGESGDALKIHRIGSDGMSLRVLGDRKIEDPDTVFFDGTGIFSGEPGSILVAGFLPDPQGGHVSRVLPNEAVEILHGPSELISNPFDMILDQNGRLLIVHSDRVLSTMNESFPTVLFSTSDTTRRIAIDSANRIFTSHTDGTIQIRDSSGELVDNNFLMVTANVQPPIATGPGGVWGNDLYVIDNGELLRVDMSGNTSMVGSGFESSVDDSSHIEFGPDGGLYLSDFNNDRIIRISCSSQLPVVKDVTMAAAEDGAAVVGSFDVADDDTSTLTYSIVDDLGDGEGTLTINENGTFTFDPGSDFQELAEVEEKTVDFTYRAVDSCGALSNTATVTITITGTNDAPTVGTGIDIEAMEDGDPVTELLNADDIDSDDDCTTLSYTIEDPLGPGEGSVTINSEDCTYTFNPGTDFQDLAEGEEITIDFTYRATDRHGTESEIAMVTITVTGVNDAPVAGDGVDIDSVIEDGDPVTQSINASDIDSDDDCSTLTYEIVEHPTEGSVTIDPATCTYTFDPGDDFQDLAEGRQRTVTFTYQVKDAHDSLSLTPGTCSITVTGVNDAPELDTIEDKMTVVGKKLEFTATAHDPDIPTVFCFELDEASMELGASIDCNGNFVWTPEMDGKFTMTVTVKDDGDPAMEDSQTFEVEVIVPWTATPDPLEFGTVSIGNGFVSNTLTVMLSNESGKEQTINSVSTDNAAFTVEDEGANLVTAGSSIFIPVTFQPTEAVLYSSKLLVETTVGTVEIDLNGTGIDWENALDIGSKKVESLNVEDIIEVPVTLRSDIELPFLLWQVEFGTRLEFLDFVVDEDRVTMEPFLNISDKDVLITLVDFQGSSAIKMGTGVIGHLVFQAKETIDFGVVPLKLVGEIDANDGGLNLVDIAGADGEIVIGHCPECPYTMDVDNDGNVGFPDIVFTFRKIFGHTVVPEGVNLPQGETSDSVCQRIERLLEIYCDGFAPLDINMDGEVGFMDIVLVFRGKFLAEPIPPGFEFPEGVTADMVINRIDCLLGK